MRCHRFYILLLVFFLLALRDSSFALEEKTVNGTIIHDSTNPKFVYSFVEDVTSLLPTDMVQVLEPYHGALKREANFVIRDDYWRRKAIGKDDFRTRLEAISTGDGNELASQLGGTVKNIFEIALRPNSPDIMGDGLKKNMREVQNLWRNGKYLVNYEGYKGQSIDSILGNLYDYSMRDKTSLYPDLVKTTADLWSAIWQRNGGKMQLVVKTFVRKPADINFRKNPGPSNTPPPRR